MARRKAHAPLNVLINNRLAGRLLKEANGAVSFQYDRSWLDWSPAFAISLSLPLRETAYSGDPVVAVFDNLLPDNPHVRRRVAERMGAQGTDYFGLLEAIGRDCVGAMQFIPDDGPADTEPYVKGETVSDEDIESILASLATAPLGVDKEQEFRISIAGAQEKTALLWHEGQWMRPIGTTPTTHLLKPQLGEIPTAFGPIDMAASVDNEHYCLKLLEAFGLDVAQTEIVTFGKRRVLVVERFDRRWRNAQHLLRLPQEDCCQAMGIPSAQKYQNNGGPGVADILTLLQRSDKPHKDQVDFFKSQILFWLIGATDGHGKNFSVFLRPEGRYGLTPFYDVLSAQPAFDKRQIPNNRYKLAMSVGQSRHYRILEVVGRHFVQTGKAAGLGPTLMTKAITEIIESAKSAPGKALALMPGDFAREVHDSIVASMSARLRILETTFDEI
ncbi:type II toxin-antitoxin system HipA family toxin [Novosphingobium cyanobacteriorum]|uniref:Type II toxin-antitoxin system HipA family toxin n=1 Tax=Novosphingobium cyanobacteriorum TaxID=3024215 RepID=A0ABT6CNP6_9SPHN|nr:type II toxin-antitoxin system HipA family toxin [Novosphingobium cyanobacteriorum]MDF8335527.1 type II toxin-antitoxin system HipA family toxin [Novosphingobium cyanobacteriorum]